MRPVPAQVRQQFGRRSDFFQGIGQHGQAVGVQFATGQLPFVVSGLSPRNDGGGTMGHIEAERAVGVADNIPK